MPKATVYKHCHTILGEQNVRLAWYIPPMHTKSKARLMKGATNSQFTGSVFAFDRSHCPAAFRWRDVVSHRLLQRGFQQLEHLSLREVVVPLDAQASGLELGECFSAQVLLASH